MTERPEPKVSVVVPVRNARAWLEPVMTAIVAAAQRHGAAEIIAVDNGSTDGSLELLRRFPGVTTVSAPGILVGAVRNRGAREARGRLLSFLDADCLVEPDYLLVAERTLEERGAAATGSPYELPHRPGWIESAWQRLHERGFEGWVGYVPAGNFFVRRAAFEEAGGFREDLSSGEDAELGQRMNDRGLRIWQSRAVSVRHLGNPGTLGAFFNKQVWHGEGMFGTVRPGEVDRPTAMMFLHAAMMLAAPAWLVAGRGPAGSRILVALAAVWLVPAVTVAFRLAASNAWSAAPAGLLLYQLYYLARLRALLRVLKTTVTRGSG